MDKKPLILGIESSCDETAASLITESHDGKPEVLSNIISSQIDIHKEYGGVVPELAARSHIEKIDWIVKKAIDESGKKILFFRLKSIFFISLSIFRRPNLTKCSGR